MIFKEALAMRCPRRKLKTLVSGGTEGTDTSKVHMYQQCPKWAVNRSIMFERIH